MKTLVTVIALLAVTATAASAGSVNGYTKSNGTYVAPYYRSAPDTTVQNNYSFKGNSDPYNGNTGTNSYSHDLTSPAFNGTPYGDGTYGHSKSLY
jgi:hypothetical protein